MNDKDLIKKLALCLRELTGSYKDAVSVGTGGLMDLLVCGEDVKTAFHLIKEAEANEPDEVLTSCPKCASWSWVRKDRPRPCDSTYCLRANSK